MSLKRTTGIKNHKLYDEVKSYLPITIDGAILQKHEKHTDANNFFGFNFDTNFRRKAMINSPFSYKSNMGQLDIGYGKKNNNENNLTLTEVFNFIINDTSLEHIAFLNLGPYDINTECKVNERLLKALQCSRIVIEIEEINNIFTRLFILVFANKNSNEYDNIISTSLDFKNNNIFINGLKEYILFYLNQDLTIEYIKDNLIHCIEQIEVANY